MIIDLIFFGIFLYTFYLGFSRGIIKTVFVWLSTAIGFMAALKFTPITKVFVERILMMNNVLVPFIAFVLTFLAVMVFIRLLATLLEKFIDAADLEMINKFAGGILSSALAVLIYSGILIFFNKASLLTAETVNSSAFYPYLETFPATISRIASKFLPFFSSMWDTTVNTMDNTKTILQDTTNAR